MFLAFLTSRATGNFFALSWFATDPITAFTTVRHVIHHLSSKNEDSPSFYQRPLNRIADINHLYSKNEGRNKHEVVFFNLFYDD